MNLDVDPCQCRVRNSKFPETVLEDISSKGGHKREGREKTPAVGKRNYKFFHLEWATSPFRGCVLWWKGKKKLQLQCKQNRGEVTSAVIKEEVKIATSIQFECLI